MHLNDGTANERWDCGTNALFDVDSGATRDYWVSFWGKVPTSWGGNEMFVAKYDTVAGTSPIHVRGNGTDLYQYERASTRYGYIAQPAADTWWHWFAWIDDSANEITIYLNGSLQSHTDYGGGFWGTGDSNSAPFEIGSLNAANMNELYVDEVAFGIDCEPTGSEAAAIYNSGTPGDLLTQTACSPSGYWRFESGDSDTTTTVYDQSGNGIDCTGTQIDAGDFTSDVP